MTNWLILCIVGMLIYAATLIPYFPAEFRPFARFIGGAVVFIGLVLLVLSLIR